jgi:alkylhydroperoxidase family enzyme
VSWISGAPQPSTLDAVLGERQALAARYRRFYRSFWTEGLIRRRVLELTRLRIAAIHDCAPEWAQRDADVRLTDRELQALRQGDFLDFPEDEQSALGLAELMPFAHHQISDEQVADIDRRFGSPGAVTLLTALAFFDVNCRLKIVLDVQS